VRSYLDENKRIFSKLPTLWPVQGGGYVTSEFGTRNSPFHFDRQERHKGADIAFYPGAPIVATADGSVMSTGYEKGFGNCLTILHAYGFMTRYAHCQSIKVMPGQPVRRGQVIATMGRTGRTTGYHLHYEIRIGREPLDPLPFMLKTPRGRQ
jgi:murein DD-endopeptidase MepM/ murein hydrolase activator NlpD